MNISLGSIVRLAGFVGVVALGGATSCASGPGNPGPFDGVWTGMSTVNINRTVPSPATQVSSGPAVVTVLGSRAAGVDFVVRIGSDNCLFNFVRTGDSANVVSGQSCTLDSMTSVMLMGMTQAEAQNVMITMVGGMASVAGSTMTLSLNYTVAITTTQMMMTTNAQQTVTLMFTGARR